MPQLLAIVAPRVLEEISPEELRELLGAVGDELVATTEEVLDLIGEDDVAFTAIPAIYVINEADVQLEIKLTVGKDEYDRGEPFEPDKEILRRLMDTLEGVLWEFCPPVVQSVSLWTKPYRESTFRISSREAKQGA